MIKINRDLIECSRLHDYEIMGIQIDYNNAIIVLEFKNLYGEPCRLTVNNFITFKMNHKEEWGKGKYVVSSDLKFNTCLNTYDIEIQLNSGDIIFIQYKEIEINI